MNTNETYPKRANDGGPAFPTTTYVDGDFAKPGISVRDYFAGQALVGLFAMAAHPGSTGIPRANYEAAARDVYLLADAMLAAREPQ